MSRREALQPRNQENNDRVPLVLTYHPSTEKVVSAIMKNTEILQQDSSTREIFKDPPLVAYKKDRSLRDLLVHSRMTPPALPMIEQQSGTSKCNRSRCNTCSHVSYATYVKGPKSTWHIRERFTCTTNNMIYAITCTACSMIYVGETKRRMADRATEHLRSIRLQTSGLPVAQHFNIPGHTINDFKICGLMKCHGGTDEDRKLREERLIHRLGCLQPNGINVSFHSFPVNK